MYRWVATNIDIYIAARVTDSSKYWNHNNNIQNTLDGSETTAVARTYYGKHCYLKRQLFYISLGRKCQATSESQEAKLKRAGSGMKSALVRWMLLYRCQSSVTSWRLGHEDLVCQLSTVYR